MLGPIPKSMRPSKPSHNSVFPGLVVAADTLFVTHRDRLVRLAARHAVPVIYSLREFATSGGLMSYGIDMQDLCRSVGVCAGRILKGTKPADLPVMQPST
jgi:putative tryptophan/tyrosine transport system substrate-binding protein